MSPADLRKYSELRSLLDGFAARHAALNAASSEGLLDRLRLIQNRLAQAVMKRDYNAFRRADFELHSTIIEIAGMPLLLDSWKRLWDHMLDFHEKGFDDYFPDARVLAQEHEHLVETIALGDPVAAEDAARSHVEAVWFRVSEQAMLPRKPEAHALQRACVHLAFRLHCPLKLTEVAQKVSFTSPGNLSRLFRRQFNLSFQAYLQKLRLEKAAELLRTTRLPIGRVAKRVGYNDVSRFGQHFKRRFRETPAAYRMSQRS
jgi:AraC-like DNA-binding protein